MVVNQAAGHAEYANGRPIADFATDAKDDVDGDEDYDYDEEEEDGAVVQ
jgi:hypothetical protein